MVSVDVKHHVYFTSPRVLVGSGHSHTPATAGVLGVLARHCQSQEPLVCRERHIPALIHSVREPKDRLFAEPLVCEERNIPDPVFIHFKSAEPKIGFSSSEATVLLCDDPERERKKEREEEDSPAISPC